MSLKTLTKSGSWGGTALGSLAMMGTILGLIGGVLTLTGIGATIGVPMLIISTFMLFFPETIREYLNVA